MRLEVTPGATNLLDLVYSYGTTANNGNLLNQTITVSTLYNSSARISLLDQRSGEIVCVAGRITAALAAIGCLLMPRHAS